MTRKLKMPTTRRRLTTAEKLLAKDTLPASYSEGAKKAYKQFQGFYGKEDGKRIFMKKALEKGVGNDVRSKINSVYKTGAHAGKLKKQTDTIIKVRGGKPSVIVLSRKRASG